MRITYEALLNDPGLIDRLHAEARYERAEAMHSLIVEPIKNFFAGQATRAHLARQG